MGYAAGTFSGRTNHQLQLNTQLASQSVEGNYSTINWQLYIVRVSGSGTYSFDIKGSSWVNIGGSVWNGGGYNYDFRSTTTKLLGSGSFNVWHNADGTGSYGFSAASDSQSTLGSASCSSSEGLPTIPRATTPTVTPASGETGSTYTIGHAPASSSFVHDIYYSLNGGSSYVNLAMDIPGTDTSTDWTPAHSLLPNSTSATAIILLRTKSSAGGSIIGDKTVNLPLTVPANIKPTISSVAWVDGQTSAPDLPTMMGGAGRFVQRWSKLKPTVTSAGAGGSTEVSSSVTQNGQTVPSGSVFPAPIALSGAVPYSANVTDTRGRVSDPYTNTVAVTAYNFPNLPTPTVQRTSDAAGNVPSPTGTYLSITPSASVSSLVFGGVEKNLLEWQIRIKPKDGAYTTVQAWNAATVSGNTWTTKYVAGGYASNTEWVVEVSIRDVFGKNGYNPTQTVTILEIPVSSEAVFMDWDGMNGIGLGHYRTQGMLDVLGQIYQNNGLAVASTSQLWSVVSILPSGANLNSYTTPGIYHQASDSFAAAGTNYPVPISGALEVLPTSNSTFAYQRYTPYGANNNVYVRRYYNGTWYAWEMLLSDKNNLARVARLLTSTAQDTGPNPGVVKDMLWSSDSAGSGMWASTATPFIFPNRAGWWRVMGKARFTASTAAAYLQVRMNGASNSPSEGLETETSAGPYPIAQDIFLVTNPGSASIAGSDYFTTGMASTGTYHGIVPANCLMTAEYIGPA